MELFIREMKPDDWNDVKRIYSQSLQEGKSTFETRCPSYEEWDNNHLSECRYVAVADIEDPKVVGWIAISPTSSREAYKGVVGHSIYVDHTFHRKGIGKQLLQHLCTEIDHRDYWCLYTAIFSMNRASIELHNHRIVLKERVKRSSDNYSRNASLTNSWNTFHQYDLKPLVFNPFYHTNAYTDFYLFFNTILLFY